MQGRLAVESGSVSGAHAHFVKKRVPPLGRAARSHEEIRRAYRRAAMRWHPDRRQNHGREEEPGARAQRMRARARSTADRGSA